MAKCPICQTKYKAPNKIYFCPNCKWDFTKYSLSSQGITNEQKSKINWAKDTWSELQSQKHEIQKNQKIIKQLISDIERLKIKQIANDFTIEEGFLRLEHWLKEAQWKYADIETGLIMLFIAERTLEGFLTKKDILNFPIDKLNRIDYLWSEYSFGRFGFGVQKYIYKTCQGKDENIYNPESWKRFCKKVGWCCEIPEFNIENYKKRLIECDRSSNTIPDKWLWGYTEKSKSFCLFAPPGHLPFLRVGGFSDNDFVDKPWGKRRIIELFSHDGLVPKNPKYHYYMPKITSPSTIINVERTSNDVMFGCTKVIEYKRLITCFLCLGTGATPTLCYECNGEGRQEEYVRLKIEIKPDQKIYFHDKEKGNEGLYGGASGDLYIYEKKT